MYNQSTIQHQLLVAFLFTQGFSCLTLVYFLPSLTCVFLHHPFWSGHSSRVHFSPFFFCFSCRCRLFREGKDGVVTIYWLPRNNYWLDHLTILALRRVV
ncbi:hypothetical protein K435DRAFT_162783 [Dendrothele bispora CBS 962.96]|uniref:Uncharacterized protein n=1 Tax=Dendrothele bispora (strain CBS 962.96) TaxID=1314807 RepID=A0A4V4HFC8_DENBC|nr:hypothetical protein K435DRAFT_162783 [Dendrothele bispora CBS 962.96]